MSFIRLVGNVALRLLPGSICFAARRHVLKCMGVNIAQDALVNHDCLIYGDGSISIGSKTWIGPGCRFYVSRGVSVDIGRNCDIAPEVAFVTGSHELGSRSRRAGRGYSESITIGDGSWLGCRAMVLGGVNLGNGTVVGAGALVNKSFGHDLLIVGIPARQIRQL